MSEKQPSITNPSKKDYQSLEKELRIATIYWQHQGRYGHRRIYHELLEEYHYQGSRERVRKHMKTLGLKAMVKRRFKITTDSQHNKPIAPNLLKQNFAMSQAN